MRYVPRLLGLGLAFALLPACGQLGDESGSASDAGILCIPEVGRYQGDEVLVFDLAWSPDGTRIISGSTSLLRSYAVDDTGTLVLLDSISSDSRFNSVQWSHDGSLVFAPNGNAVRVYSLAEDGELSELASGPLHNVELQRVALSPDGNRLLSCDIAGVTHLYDIDYDGPTLVERGQVKAHDLCTRVAWSPSGSLALSAGRGGFIVLYQVKEDELRISDQFDTEEESGEAIFGIDDTEAFGGSFGQINALWSFKIDPSTGTMEVVERYQGHKSGVGAMEWSHNMQHLVTGAHDHGTHILGRDTLGGKLVFKAHHPESGSGVHSARWSPDDAFLARTSSNQDLLTVHRIGTCQ